MAHASGPTLPSLSMVDPQTAPLGDCVHFVLDRFHAFERGEMARLPGMFREAVATRAQLQEAARTFEGLVSELQSHFDKEERILLPYIASLGSPGPLPRAPFGTMEAPLRVMTMEHDAAKDAIARLRELTGGLRAPEDEGLRPLWDALRVFTGDVLAHIAYEDVLFPRAVHVEAERRA